MVQARSRISSAASTATALPFVPEWTLALGGDYEWSVFGDSTAYVGGQVAYTGDRLADFGNRVDPLDPTSARHEADSYTTLDLRTGIIWDNWSLELYGKNVTDEDGHHRHHRAGHFPERRRRGFHHPAADGRPCTRRAVLTGHRTE